MRLLDFIRKIMFNKHDCDFNKEHSGQNDYGGGVVLNEYKCKNKRCKKRILKLFNKECGLIFDSSKYHKIKRTKGESKSKI